MCFDPLRPKPSRRYCSPGFEGKEPLSMSSSGAAEVWAAAPDAGLAGAVGTAATPAPLIGVALAGNEIAVAAPISNSAKTRSRVCKITERFLQFAKPWFEVLPLFGGAAVDRFADLFRRRRQHGATGFPETEAALVERQTAIIQHPADFGLGIVNQIFIADVQDAPGHDGLDILHLRNIGAVIVADMHQIVAE